MSEEKKEQDNHFLSESPIELSKQDLLNYKHYAEKVRKVIQNNSDNSNPLTIGIYGKWGEGKTSFLNLLDKQIDIFKKEEGDKGIMKYHFNPWRYGTEDEMLFAFFEGLAQKLFLTKETGLKIVGNYILRFSRYLKAIKLSTSAGVPMFLGAKMTFDPSKIFQVLGEDIKGEELSLESFKEKIDDALKDSNYKIVIFIDDIDRLDKNEIYTLLKIVKLNGNFKNLVYIITMDPDQVARAIKSRYGDNDNDGELFLEKIINIPIHLPKVEYIDLKIFFEKKLFQTYSSIYSESKYLDPGNEKKIELEEIIDNYRVARFSTPREIIRILNSFYIGLFSIGDEVNISDLFWIEYLKIKHSSSYKTIKNYDKNQLHLNVSRITSDDIFGNNKVLENKDFSGIVSQVFPNKIPSEKDEIELHQSIRVVSSKKQKRVNHKDHFDKYFSYHLENKIIIGDFNLYLDLVISDKNNEVSISIKDLIKKYGDKQSLYELELLIDDLQDKDKNKLLNSLIENREFFDDNNPNIFAKTTKIELIEKVAILFDSIKELDKELILAISDKLNYQELSYFTRKFKNISFKNELEQRILTKAKSLSEEDKPFFKYPENIMNKMVMSIWKDLEPKTFDELIKNNLNSREEVGLLVRNFPGYWNGSFFGTLTKENYDFMKSLVDVHFVYDKVRKYFNIDLEKLDISKLDDRDERTIDENVKEFWFHYTNDQKEKTNSFA